MITRVLTTCGGAGIVSIVEATNIVAGSKATSNAQWAKCDLKCHWKAKNESTAVAVIPSAARLLLSLFSWWLTRGSVGNASRAFKPGSAGCRMVVRRWQNSAATRLQRFLRRRWRRRGVYCALCDVLLNGPIQYRDHCIGKAHKRRLDRRDRSSIVAGRLAAVQLSRA